MRGRYVLALDEGSTSARAVVVDEWGGVRAEARRGLRPFYRHPGWVELDPMAVWRAQLDAALEAIASAGIGAADLACVGITTSRETAMVWDRRTGTPCAPAIMWMSTQTDDIVDRWRAEGLDAEFRRVTGLFNDSFVTAPKLTWFLEQVPGLRRAALAGEVVAGTLDTWLLWQLTGGRSHLTDHSEASRTGLFDLDELGWSEELCAALDIPLGWLPPTVASDSTFGEIDAALLRGTSGVGIPVTGILGDQQAGMLGQGCLEPGDVKATYGTAGVLTANCGPAPARIDGLTTSVAWTAAGVTLFEAEGVVFHCGQTLQWLGDRLGLFESAEDIGRLARSVDDNGGVYVVPAFAGLCAPHWDREARGAMVGLCLDTSAAHLVRAGVEAMAYQTRDNVDALRDGGVPVDAIKLDGGGARDDLVCQLTADICDVVVSRPEVLEQTARGIALLAGTSVGMWRYPNDLRAAPARIRTFEPSMAADQREQLYAGWRSALESARSAVRPAGPPARRTV